jgi:hypothetical protein
VAEPLIIVGLVLAVFLCCLFAGTANAADIDKEKIIISCFIEQAKEDLEGFIKLNWLQFNKIIIILSSNNAKK